MLLAATLAAVLAVVAGVASIALSESATFGAGAVVVLIVVLLALMAYVYAFTARTGVEPGPVTAPLAPLGTGVSAERMRSALVPARGRRAARADTRRAPATRPLGVRAGRQPRFTRGPGPLVKRHAQPAPASAAKQGRGY